ncbi:tRNA-dihydrouridine(20a/20b) synthase [NAD(P)+]-like isoform X2 [Littorina saxatilis]|uniref:tRNA-dihydrouridine(20a/20b) synthase [NAD(P)+]-like isoform X2 n=1 Tax=Littorina saxatilis TaxID=31220 RepID=UPI0038B6A785
MATGSTFQWTKPMELFSSGKPVKICAPMVRYSKLPFRMLVRKYDCDLAYTPMIISDSFVKSLRARDSDFTTCAEDRPLIVQFAASCADDFADAAEIVAPWAMTEGYGACLLGKPELLYDMVRQARDRVGDPDFTVSIKIRIHDDIRKTVELCQRAEKCGAAWISVHGRTKDQRCQPVNCEAIRTIKDSVSVPVIANGDIKSLADVDNITEKTGVDGVMSARGILANPAMYAGFDETPVQCVKDWLDISLSLGTSFQCFHHHLIYMMDKLMSRAERRVFNSLASTSAVIDFIRENYSL